MAIDWQKQAQETDKIALEAQGETAKLLLALKILAKHAYGDRWEEFVNIALVEASEQ